ncbi:L-serine ammonia-lyase [Salinicola sp. LHM]|uniref:L-serine ammonia-lyase n=1 Tax=Salinicola sp. LHM TaxID=3065298 RepID=UPI002ACD7F38|nr:L-serine ammonia-lyase [Salinicola sp. LHM]WQH34286.1 L-serine ammonia-lyase [Salinicola sp. LHM]
MTFSVFDLFKIGIGPSSSHTVGPMQAAHDFVAALHDRELLHAVARVSVTLYGSLSATGKGHNTDSAVMGGLMGERPLTVDPDDLALKLAAMARDGELKLAGVHAVAFDPARDIEWCDEILDYHTNALRLVASDDHGVIYDNTYYSVGGGFVVDAEQAAQSDAVTSTVKVPYPFKNAVELLDICRREGLSISDVMLANEQVWRSESDIRDGLWQIWLAMKACVDSGLDQQGVLPGGLNVRRRAPALHRRLMALDNEKSLIASTFSAMDWVNLFALAVNEENAAGRRMVTAPTNGAAGIVPAVLHYYMKFQPDACERDVVRFLLTAGAIGILCKTNASISGAEVGCQGEVGSACAMAAAGLAELMGGTPAQVENAAEIGLEHNLGLTCDPIAGLVQVPCIERNAIAAVKAINAAQMALCGDGEHFVSLDKVIRTMRETGRDMQDKYKETSRGGLAVNIIEC